MRSTCLKPLYEGEEYVKELVKLSPEKKKQTLKQTEELDFTHEYFKDYLTSKSLYTGIFGYKESAVQFAKRVYLQICKDFIYLFPAAQKVSDIVLARKGDCGALSKMFVATLRASEIPARLLYGRWASSNNGEKLQWLDGSADGEYEQTHVMAQFYMENCGWIPVDVSRYVANMNPLFDEKKQETYLGGFGKENGTFITWSEDRSLIEMPSYGPKLINLQDFDILFENKKLMSEWKVKQVDNPPENENHIP